LALGPDIEAPDTTSLGPEERRLARRSLSALGSLSVGSAVGLASSAYLVNHYPLLLIALSPIGRHLILVVPRVDPVAFILVGGLRRFAFYLACFHLGRALGPPGVVWLEERAARFARFVRWIESWFRKAPRLVVLFFAGPTVSALAGMSGMPLGTYLGLASLSLLARLLLILAFGELLREPIEWLLAWIDVYWVQITGVMVLGVLLYQWWRIRRSRRRADQPLQST
jgi:membrane protein DedA with SNARE-associated domain